MAFDEFFVFGPSGDLKTHNKNLRAALEKECASNRLSIGRIKELEHSNRCLEAVGAQRLDELWAADAKNDVQGQEITKLQHQLNHDRKEIGSLERQYKDICAHNRSLADKTKENRDLIATRDAQAAEITRLTAERDKWEKWYRNLFPFYPDKPSQKEPIIRLRGKVVFALKDHSKPRELSAFLMNVVERGPLEASGTIKALLTGSVSHPNLDPDKCYDITITESA